MIDLMDLLTVLDSIFSLICRQNSQSIQFKNRVVKSIRWRSFIKAWSFRIFMWIFLLFLESAQRVISPIAISNVQCDALGTRRATGREETDERGPFCSQSPSRCACVWRTDMRIVMSITNEDSRQGWLSQASAAVTAARVLSRVHKTREKRL